MAAQPGARGLARRAAGCQCAESGLLSAKQLEMLSEERASMHSSSTTTNDNNNNNNNDDHTSNHNHNQSAKQDEKRAMAGRRASESRCSSALSSSSCALDELDAASSSARSTPLSSSASSSGLGQHSASPSPEPAREAAARGQLSSAQANNLVPETGHVRRLVEAVRERLLASLEAEPAGQQQQQQQQLEESDLAAMRAELGPAGQLEQSLAARLIVRFFQPGQLSSLAEPGAELERALDEAALKLRELLAFRARYQLARCRHDQFCQEFAQLHGIFTFGRDRQQLPVLYLRAQVHRRWSAKLDDQFRRYVAWQIDQLTRSQPVARVAKRATDKEGSFGICFDCLNVSYSCVDMDFLRFLVRLLVHYYPTYCRYALCVDLPWLFRSVWKLVRSWLPEDAQNTVQLITSNQLTDFIDEDQIPASIKLTSRAAAKQQLPTQANELSEKRKHKMPPNYENIRNFDQFAQELGLGATEIKAFKAHLDKVLKEYRQLGAI